MAMYPASRLGSERHTLSVLVENRPGVLARIAGLFARRAFNINSLSVSPTERPDISRVTVTADVEAVPLEQIIKQLNKLLHVLKIVELDPNTTVERELVLIKVAANESNRSDVLEIVRLFRACCRCEPGVADHRGHRCRRQDRRAAGSVGALRRDRAGAFRRGRRDARSEGAERKGHRLRD